MGPRFGGAEARFSYVGPQIDSMASQFGGTGPQFGELEGREEKAMAAA